MRTTGNQSDYRCPGERVAISRAIHLARLADGYPACRHCLRCDDTDGLSGSMKKRAEAALRSPVSPEWFHEEGAAGDLHRGFDAQLAGRLATAFGSFLRSRMAAGGGSPTVVAANDGRTLTQELFAAAVERLRWAACDVVELGSATSPALAWTIAQSRADGGLFVGNPGGHTYSAGAKFFLAGGEPVSAGDRLSAIRQAVHAPPCRPKRAFGSASRLSDAGSYRDRFAESFHGLRPLRFALDTTCGPFGDGVARLLESTACKMVRRSGVQPPGAAGGTAGHFAMAVDDDGERCRIWNERAESVSPDRLLLLVARMVFSDGQPDRTAVLDPDFPGSAAVALTALGARVVRSRALRADVHEAMRSHGARLGGDVSGRIWYAADGHIAADALGTLTLLLNRLSRDDRPLSKVLDDDVPGH